jgi:hypothetical protein
LDRIGRRSLPRDDQQGSSKQKLHHLKRNLPRKQRRCVLYRRQENGPLSVGNGLPLRLTVLATAGPKCGSVFCLASHSISRSISEVCFTVDGALPNADARKKKREVLLHGVSEDTDDVSKKKAAGSLTVLARGRCYVGTIVLMRRRSSFKSAIEDCSVFVSMGEGFKAGGGEFAESARILKEELRNSATPIQATSGGLCLSRVRTR